MQLYISPKRLANEINNSHWSLRHRFLSSLSFSGSWWMLKNLLSHGLSLGNHSTYYCEKARKREHLSMVLLFLDYGASLSLESFTQLLNKAPDLEKLFLDPYMSLAFCGRLEQALELLCPLHELDD